jgi:hypothetical protein
MLIALIQSVVMRCHDAIMPAVLNYKYKSNIIRSGKILTKCPHGCLALPSGATVLFSAQHVSVLPFSSSFNFLLVIFFAISTIVERVFLHTSNPCFSNLHLRKNHSLAFAAALREPCR